MISGVRREGYLLKQGKIVKKLKNRWFELWDDRLVYFEDKDSLKELGTIELQNIIDISAIADPFFVMSSHLSLNQPHSFSSMNPNLRNSEQSDVVVHAAPYRNTVDGNPSHKDSRGGALFRVETSDRTYVLKADTLTVMREWIEALKLERENYCDAIERFRQRGLSFEGVVPTGSEFFKHVIEKEEAGQFRNEGIQSFIESGKQQPILPFPKFTSQRGSDTAHAHHGFSIAVIRFKNNSNVNFIKITFRAMDPLPKVLESAIAKYRSKASEMPLTAKPSQFMFKVTGFHEYLYGDDEVMQDFDYVHDAQTHHRTCDFILMRKPSEADAFAILNSLNRLMPTLGVGEGPSSDGDVPAGFMPLSEIAGKFRVKLVCARQLSLDSPSLSRARAMAEAAGGGLICRVECCLSLGVDLLCKPVLTEPVPGRLSVKFDEWVQFDVLTRDLPRAAKLCITLFGGVSGTRVQVPLAWVNVQLFDYRGVLRERESSLKMWMNDRANLLATCQQNTDLSKPPPTLELVFDEHPRRVIWVGAEPSTSNEPNINKLERVLGTDSNSDHAEILQKIQRLAKQDMLQELSDNDRAILWQRRDQAKLVPTVLPKVLRSIDWTTRQQVAEMKRLLAQWGKLEVRDAIELLDAKYAEQFVRDYAVRCLDAITESHLEEILPQLVQAIKHEPYHSSSLARFLFARALRSPHRIGHLFFWYLKAEMHNVAIRERYGVLLSSYMDGRSELLRRQYVEEADLIKSLIEGARMVKSLPKPQRTATLRQFLSSLRVPPEFTLPISSRLMCKGFIIEKCRCLSSATAPLLLIFENSDPYGGPIAIIFKVGDDLRQDILTLQMFQIMDRIWCDSGIDLSMTLYKCMAVDNEVGLIEVVPESETVANITRNHRQGSKLGGALAAFKQSPLLEWMKAHNPQDEELKTARNNFLRSCAAYCVATYVLGIGDRHNDNVMITKNGNLFHIDFGHFLGNFQKFLGVNRDRAPFVFTPDFAFVMGGRESDDFNKFMDLCGQAYNVLRHNCRVFINLFGLMLSTGIPELKTPGDLDFLRDTLLLDATDDEAARRFRDLIMESLNTKSTQLNNAIHILAN